jgi:hypothetical protein
MKVIYEKDILDRIIDADAFARANDTIIQRIELTPAEFGQLKRRLPASPHTSIATTHMRFLDHDIFCIEDGEINER